MKKSIFHAAAGILAILTVATFWVSSLISELFLDHQAVVLAKGLIANYGIYGLIFMMASVGGSGFAIGKNKKNRFIDSKTKRMRFLALNALVVMIPSAYFLNTKAVNGEFDTIFYIVQVIELVAGAMQLTLLGLNFRDGLKMTGRLRAKT